MHHDCHIINFCVVCVSLLLCVRSYIGIYCNTILLNNNDAAANVGHSSKANSDTVTHAQRFVGEKATRDDWK